MVTESGESKTWFISAKNHVARTSGVIVPYSVILRLSNPTWEEKEVIGSTRNRGSKIWHTTFNNKLAFACI